jgi:hypothetical protein
MDKPKSQPAALMFAVLAPLCFVLVLVFPQSHAAFQAATAAHPYIMGFVKFALLATTGDILAGKLSGGAFAFPKSALPKAAIWGVIGMMVALTFPLFNNGVMAAQELNLLFGGGNNIITAILTSAVMNLTFGPVMMAFHRVTDTALELRSGGRAASLKAAVAQIDWPGFVGFVVCRTIPFFWIPAHALTFLLPYQYRVFASAFLSIALGLLLAIAKKRGGKK